MWLEQTAWIWAPLACAALVWTAFRLGALGCELRSLRTRVAELERARSGSWGQAETVRHTRIAA